VARLDDPQRVEPSGRRGRLTPRQAAAVAGLIDAVAGLDAGQVLRLHHDLNEAIREEATDDRRRIAEGREG
jgi:hypothetical protein